MVAEGGGYIKPLALGRGSIPRPTRRQAYVLANFARVQIQPGRRGRPRHLLDGKPVDPQLVSLAVKGLLKLCPGGLFSAPQNSHAEPTAG